LDKVHKTYFDEDQLKAIGLTDKEIKVVRGEKQHYLAQLLRGWEFLIVLISVLWVGAFIVVSGAQSAAL
jgi:5-bromo-4-chloroindolyl phosphate hydrolysis protein